MLKQKVQTDHFSVASGVWMEDEAPLSALSAWVSCDLRCWFIFEPAPREADMVKTPQNRTCKDLERIKSRSF